MAGKKLDFEQSMARLEEIVGLLERGTPRWMRPWRSLKRGRS